MKQRMKAIMINKNQKVILCCTSDASIYTLKIDDISPLSGDISDEAITIDTGRASIVNIKRFFEFLVIKSFENDCIYELSLDEEATKALAEIDSNLLSLIHDHIQSFNEMYNDLTDSREDNMPDTITPSAS